MTIVLIVAALVAVWAWKQGHIQALRFGDLAAGVAGLGALRLASKGQGMVAVGVLLAVAAWIWLRQTRSPAMADEEARALLELGPGADADAIRSAHRRLIARVHPDSGGSADLARRVNAARDVLLAGMNRAKR